MIDIKRLHRIMEEKGTDPDVTMHDLVREVLKRDYDRDDYSLENISTPVEEGLEKTPEVDEEDEDSDHSANSSAVHQSFEEVELKFRAFQDEDHQQELIEAYNQESLIFNTIEQLKSRAKNGWTHLIKSRTTSNNNEDFD